MRLPCKKVFGSSCTVSCTVSFASVMIASLTIFDVAFAVLFASTLSSSRRTSTTLAMVADAGGNTEVLSLVVIGAGGNGKAVELLDFDFDEILTEDMVVASAETTEHGREYFKSADSVLVLFEDARVCDLKHGIF